MILTVTPNPTIDRVLFVRNFDKQDFFLQDVVRAEGEVISPSGKGIDVSLILHTMGQMTRAIALNAGRHGALLAQLVAEHVLPVDWIAAEGETRMATLLTDVATGRQMTILAHTLAAQPELLDQILARVDAHATWSWGLVCAGSLPPGLPVDTYAQVIARAAQHGLFTLLDSSGPSLHAGVAARPHVLKVNLGEFAGLMAETNLSQQHLSPGEADCTDRDCTDRDCTDRDCTAGDVDAAAAIPPQFGFQAGHGPDIQSAESCAANGTPHLPLHSECPVQPQSANQNDSTGAENGRAAQPHTGRAGSARDAEIAAEFAADFQAGIEREGIDPILRLAEQMHPYLGEWAREAIIVTLGRQGILAVTNGGTYYAPGLSVPVVSPAGAGDAVAAGIMLGRRRGEDWPSTLIWASALAVTVIGNAGTAECRREDVMARAEEATVIELNAAG